MRDQEFHLKYLPYRVHKPDQALIYLQDRPNFLASKSKNNPLD